MPFELLDWLLQSSDFNPIENACAITKEKIFEKTAIIDSIQNLENVIEDISF
jgi:hypothetical protein